MEIRNDGPSAFFFFFSFILCVPFIELFVDSSDIVYTFLLLVE